MHMEQYRSGHNGHDWKSCVPQKGTEGSNPSCSARKEKQMRKHLLFSFLANEVCIAAREVAGAVK